MTTIEREDFEYIYTSNIDYNYLDGKTLLIVGGTSFLFSYFVKSLLYYNIKKARKPVNIVVIVRNMRKAALVYAEYLNNRFLTIIQHDVINSITLDIKIDIIIHAASQASPKYYGIDPVGTLNANVIGTYNLLEFAKKNKISDFLFISSGDVYGVVEKKYVAETDFGHIDCCNLRSCYSEGKRAAETMCISYSYQYGVNTKIIRLFHTYGPDISFDDGRVFADFAKNIINAENIVLKSEGTAIRSFCYVADMLDGLLRVLFYGKCGNAYNISNPNETYSIKELAVKLVDFFAEKKIKVIMDIRNPSKEYIESFNAGRIADILKITALGFVPKITILEGFKKIVDHYNENSH